MTNLTPCELHEMIGCTICSGREAREARERSATEDSRPFTARYDGQCPVCDLPIHAGRDRIVMRDRGTYSYVVHETCQ